MNVPESQITVKKTIGKLDGKPVRYVKTVGGLHLIADWKGTVLGAAPHRAVARHIASKNASGIEWTELSKGEHIPVENFKHLLPEYEALTNEFRKAQGIDE
jgi:hypothetical protein